MIKEKIKAIINEIQPLDIDLDIAKNLVSGDYLDSFNVLMLIHNLEAAFNVKLEFNGPIADQLDSIEQIEKLIVDSKSSA